MLICVMPVGEICMFVWEVLKDGVEAGGGDEPCV